MKLLALHPLVAQRTCEDCRKYLYNADGTQVTRGRAGEEKPVARHLATMPTPCWKCPKIPKGVDPLYTNACEFGERQWKIWLHYQECRLTNLFPDDPWVKYHAFVIGMQEEGITQGRLLNAVETIQYLLTARK